MVNWVAMSVVVIQDGIVAWVVRFQTYEGSLFDVDILYRVYDPERGWMGGSWELSPPNACGRNVGGLTIQDGIVVWAAAWGIGVVTCDPLDTSKLHSCTESMTLDVGRGWKESGLGLKHSPPHHSSQMQLSHGGPAGQSYTRGYDPGIGSWYAGPTKPLAYFIASESSGLPRCGCGLHRHVNRGDKSELEFWR